MPMTSITYLRLPGRWSPAADTCSAAGCLTERLPSRLPMRLPTPCPAQRVSAAMPLPFCTLDLPPTATLAWTLLPLPATAFPNTCTNSIYGTTPACRIPGPLPAANNHMVNHLFACCLPARLPVSYCHVCTAPAPGTAVVVLRCHRLPCTRCLRSTC